MRDQFLPYNQSEVGEDEVRAVTDALRSGWLTRGSKTAQFEAALAAYLGVDQVVAVSSCTAGLHLALLASGIGPGDEVITTPMTFVASVNVILHVGATPVLVDIDAETGNIDSDLVEQAIGPHTRAVLPVHYAGHSVDMRRMNHIRDRYGLTIIEDAAHALASRQDGRLVGSFGNLTAFSFYATKNLTTGEGGALVVPDPAMADAVRVRSLHGLSRHAWNRYSHEGSWRYDVEVLGFKYNMTDVEAAMGLVQLAKLPAMQAKRQALASRYQAGLQGLALTLPVVRPRYEHAWHLFPVRLDLRRIRGTRADVVEDLRQANIGTSVHFIPIHHHSYFQEHFGWKEGDFPNADAFFAEEISLPLYPGMSLSDVDEVVETLAAILEARRR